MNQKQHHFRKLGEPNTYAVVTRRQELTDDLWIMWLKTENPFAFKPGQYITIGTDGIERPYSIASSPNEPEIELFIELIPPPEGVLTPCLYLLKAGDKLSIRPRAKGLFLFNPKYINHVMIGTVTGITPYLSILRHYFETAGGKHRFFILEGASYCDEFGYGDELQALADTQPNVVFIPTVSRPDVKRNSNWKGEKGRVNTIIEKYLVDWNLDPKNTLIYACGHPLMIEDVRKRLAQSPFTLTEERFWAE